MPGEWWRLMLKTVWSNRRGHTKYRPARAESKNLQSAHEIVFEIKDIAYYSLQINLGYGDIQKIDSVMIIRPMINRTRPKESWMPTQKVPTRKELWKGEVTLGKPNMRETHA